MVVKHQNVYHLNACDNCQVGTIRFKEISIQVVVMNNANQNYQYQKMTTHVVCRNPIRVIFESFVTKIHDISRECTTTYLVIQHQISLTSRNPQSIWL